MNREEMKQIIYDYVKAKQNVSYVELENLFERYEYPYEGNIIYKQADNEVMLWDGWTEDAFAMIAELVKEGRLVQEPCNVLVYAIDGKMKRCPIPTKNQKYKTLHWVPTVFCTGPEFVTVKEIRKHLGLSQSKFAEHLGIPVYNIQKWEQGINQTPPYVMHLIRELLKAWGEI